MIQFGLRPRETRESVWRGDPAVRRVLDPDRYERTGEADCLDVDPAASPLRVRYRPLTADEHNVAVDLATEAEADGATVRIMPARLSAVAFAIGVDLPDLPDKVRVADGKGGIVEVRKTEIRAGVRMLSRQFLQALVDTSAFGDEALAFYARLVLAGARAAPEDFSASSQAHGNGTNSMASPATAAPASSSGPHVAPTSETPTPASPAA